MMKEYYYIEVWKWDAERQEYLPQSSSKSENLEYITGLFKTIKIDADTTQATIWCVTEEDSFRVAFKDTVTEEFFSL